LDKIPDRIDSKFRFVLLSAARAEQMIQGASARSEGDSPKFTRVAMDEITSEKSRQGLETRLFVARLQEQETANRLTAP
jgi:DNA-directed RNA polymerase subunit K/omega